MYSRIPAVQAAKLERELVRTGSEFMAANIQANIAVKAANMTPAPQGPEDVPRMMEEMRGVRDVLAELGRAAEAFALALDNIVRSIDPPARS